MSNEGIFRDGELIIALVKKKKGNRICRSKASPVSIEVFNRSLFSLYILVSVFLLYDKTLGCKRMRERMTDKINLVNLTHSPLEFDEVKEHLTNFFLWIPRLCIAKSFTSATYRNQTRILWWLIPSWAGSFSFIRIGKKKETQPSLTLTVFFWFDICSFLRPVKRNIHKQPCILYSLNQEWYRDVKSENMNKTEEAQPPFNCVSSSGEKREKKKERERTRKPSVEKKC